MPEQLHLPWDEAPAGARPEPAAARAGRRRTGDDWRLDARTRRVGLKGLARARAALAAASGQDARGADAA